jgi:hypothetical protein
MKSRGNFKGKHKDNVQFYNVPKQDGVHDFKHPLPIESKLEQIQNFTRVRLPSSPIQYSLTYIFL